MASLKDGTAIGMGLLIRNDLKKVTP